MYLTDLSSDIVAFGQPLPDEPMFLRERVSYDG